MRSGVLTAEMHVRNAMRLSPSGPIFGGIALKFHVRDRILFSGVNFTGF